MLLFKAFVMVEMMRGAQCFGKRLSVLIVSRQSMMFGVVRSK